MIKAEIGIVTSIRNHQKMRPKREGSRVPEHGLPLDGRRRCVRHLDGRAIVEREGGFAELPITGGDRTHHRYTRTWRQGVNFSVYLWILKNSSCEEKYRIALVSKKRFGKVEGERIPRTTLK